MKNEEVAEKMFEIFSELLNNQDYKHPGWCSPALPLNKLRNCFDKIQREMKILKLEDFFKLRGKLDSSNKEKAKHGK